jgi:hypothetical protein
MFQFLLLTALKLHADNIHHNHNMDVCCVLCPLQLQSYWTQNCVLLCYVYIMPRLSAAALLFTSSTTLNKLFVFVFLFIYSNHLKRGLGKKKYVHACNSCIPILWWTSTVCAPCSKYASHFYYEQVQSVLHIENVHHIFINFQFTWYRQNFNWHAL